MTNLTTLIDQFGALAAQIAELEIQKSAMKAAFADLAVGNYEGEDYRLSVTAPEREKLSDEMKARQKAVVDEAVAAFRATLSVQYRTAHITTVATPTFTPRARTSKALAA